MTRQLIFDAFKTMEVVDLLENMDIADDREEGTYVVHIKGDSTIYNVAISQVGQTHDTRVVVNSSQFDWENLTFECVDSSEFIYDENLNLLN